jgi:hypothetical protein
VSDIFDDKRLEKILNWAEMPYRSLPLELPKKVQEMVDAYVLLIGISGEDAEG